MNRTLTSCLLLGFVHSSAGLAASLDMLWDANPYNPASPTDSISFTVTTPSGSGSTHPDRYHGKATNLVGITNADLVDGTNGSLFTYCYEVTQFYSGGSTIHYTLDASVVTSGTLDFLGAVNEVLANNTSPFAWLDPIGPYAVTPSHTIAAVNVAAAIQLGIWETKYDTSFNLGSGNFRVSGIDSPTQEALDLFVNAMPASGSLSGAYVTGLVNPDAQDQITALRTVRRQQLPEPGTLALLALAAPAIVALRRRARRVP